MYPWTRKALSERMKKYWADMPADEREARLALRRAQYRRRHPERAAAYDQAMLDRQPCYRCGGEAWPVFAKLPSNEVLGWRCREHHPAREKETPPGEPEGVSSAGEVLD